MSKATQTAAKLLSEAKQVGFDVSVRGGILTLSRTFEPGDNEAFTQCDMSYFGVLGLLPRTSPGSDWGTDGGGVGAISAIKAGRFTMNRSGGSKRVLSALEKMLS